MTSKFLTYKHFFVVGGTGLSETSSLNAFDKALVEARVDQCNLVPVSSIIPLDATPIDYATIPPGSIVFCVLARKDGTGGERISAGVGWAICEGLKSRQKFGVVAEDTGNKTEIEVRNSIQKKLGEMARARKMRVVESKIETKTIEKIPPKNHGSVMVVLVYAD